LTGINHDGDRYSPKCWEFYSVSAWLITWEDLSVTMYMNTQLASQHIVTVVSDGLCSVCSNASSVFCFRSSLSFGLNL